MAVADPAFTGSAASASCGVDDVTPLSAVDGGSDAREETTPKTTTLSTLPTLKTLWKRAKTAAPDGARVASSAVATVPARQSEDEMHLTLAEEMDE